MNRRWISPFVLALSFLIIFSTEGLPEDAQQESVESVKSVHPVSEDRYLIGPEDVLEVSVWKESELTKLVVVRPDGRMSFPLIGEIQAGGRTVEWLQNEIKSRLEGFMSEAVVSVTVQQVNSMRIYVIGTVLRPGEFKIGRNIHVMQALSLAGGLAPFADADSIVILRTENGKQIKIGFNYEEVKLGKKLEQNIFLKTGDVVVVP